MDNLTVNALAVCIWVHQYPHHYARGEVALVCSLTFCFWVIGFGVGENR